MYLKLPDINEIIVRGSVIDSEFMEEKQTTRKPIIKWMEDHKAIIQQNLEYVRDKNDDNDMKILRILLSDYLMRAMRGERSKDIREQLDHFLKSKNDLHESNYKTALEKAKYRWGTDIGAEVISSVVKVAEELKWDWLDYFKQAKNNEHNNFSEDKFLKIKNISFKVRDLALSNFNENYVAFDLHLSKVPTRIGLLNYGYDLCSNGIEMGNNPANEENYLFLHSLFLKLSKMSGRTMGEMDRFFWHLGRAVCKNNPKCAECPLSDVCLTGNKGRLLQSPSSPAQ